MDYCPNTGVFRWNSKRNKINIGDTVGSISNEGYVTTKINGKGYKCHRLAWLYTYGEMPRGQIDHINHCRSDNRIVNLRDIKAVDNARNATKRKDNSSGVTGVFQRKDTERWIAQIAIDKITKHIGSYATFEEAVEARKNKAIELEFHFNHGSDNDGRDD